MFTRVAVCPAASCISLGRDSSELIRASLEHRAARLFPRSRVRRRPPLGAPSSAQAQPGITITVLAALLVCLIPTTIGGLMPAIGIAGMDRLIRHNVIALSGRAIEAAGDVDVLLLDKTGTITLGNRQAVAFIPVGNTTERELAEAAQMASLADETPEGRSIVVLAKEKYGLRGTAGEKPADITYIPFSAQTRMSGVDSGTLSIRKGAADSIIAYIQSLGKTVPEELRNDSR